MVERSSHYNEVSLTSPLCYANGGAKSPLSTTLHFAAVLLHSVQWLTGGLFFWTQLYVVLINVYEITDLTEFIFKNPMRLGETNKQ